MEQDRSGQRGGPAFIMRGEAMSRIETFVAAAFAFAITMLIISLDAIPTSADEFVAAAKQIPAFAASFASIVSIWYAHAMWCKKYGLEDKTTIWLSALLVFIVLVYIYPLRLVMQGLFEFLSDGFFPFEMAFSSYWEVRFMFAFYAVGFLALAVTFILFYFHTLRLRKSLELTEYELFDIRSRIFEWAAILTVCVMALAFALLLPSDSIAYSPFSFMLLFPIMGAIGWWREAEGRKIIAKHGYDAE